MQKKADHLREGAQASSSSTVISFNHYTAQQRRRNSCKVCPLTHDKWEGMYLQDPRVSDGGCWGMLLLLLLEQSYGLHGQLVSPSKAFVFLFKIQAGETVMCKEESAEVQVRMENHVQLQ